jgi:hypothetical protein
MMQNITKQHCVEAVVSHGEMTAIVRKVIDAGGSAGTDV